MPNGLDLEGQFRGGKRSARASYTFSFVAAIATAIGYLFYGIVGLAWVSVLQGAILVMAAFAVDAMGSGIFLSLRGTRDESTFMERVRIRDDTYREIRDLLSQVHSIKRELKEVAKMAAQCRKISSK